MDSSIACHPLASRKIHRCGLSCRGTGREAVPHVSMESLKRKLFPTFSELAPYQKGSCICERICGLVCRKCGRFRPAGGYGIDQVMASGSWHRSRILDVHHARFRAPVTEDLAKFVDACTGAFRHPQKQRCRNGYAAAADLADYRVGYLELARQGFVAADAKAGEQCIKQTVRVIVKRNGGKSLCIHCFEQMIF